MDNTLTNVFRPLMDTGRLISVFSHETTAHGDSWSSFRTSPIKRDGRDDRLLKDIKPLKGYLIEISPGPSVSLNLSSVELRPAELILKPGWNLVGFGNYRRTFWADLLGPNAHVAEVLFGWNETTGAYSGFLRPQFQRFDANDDGHTERNEFDWFYGSQIGDMRFVEPFQAIWVRVDKEVAVGPILEVESESDVDPFSSGEATNSWYQSGIDTDFNTNGRLDYGFTMTGQRDPYGNPYLNTQDTIWFRTPTGAAHSNLTILRQELTIKNEGTGVLYFEMAEWPTWLTLLPTNGFVNPGPGGQRLMLVADIAQLPVGEQRGSIRIRSNGRQPTQTKEYNVRLTVPGFDGVYSGEMILTNVAGRDSMPMILPIRLILRTTGLTRVQGRSSPWFGRDIEMQSYMVNDSVVLSSMISASVGEVGNPMSVPIARELSMEVRRIQATDGETKGRNIGLTGTFLETIHTGSNPALKVSGSLLLNPETDKDSLEEPR
jgi:hypothetical protein